jgi:hypothetical protein
MQREVLNVLSKKILAGVVDKDLSIVADANWKELYSVTKQAIKP